jgi:hypothetical protein
VVTPLDDGLVLVKRQRAPRSHKRGLTAAAPGIQAARGAEHADDAGRSAANSGECSNAGSGRRHGTEAPRCSGKDPRGRIRSIRRRHWSYSRCRTAISAPRDGASPVRGSAAPRRHHG